RGGRLDLLDAEPLPFPRARADALDALPVVGRFKVLGPEGPRLALDRPGGVHGAAGGLVPEDAVATGLLFEAVTVPNPADELHRELLDGLTAELGQAGDLLGVDPDIPRRAGAAGTTAGAFE